MPTSLASRMVTVSRKVRFGVLGTVSLATFVTVGGLSGPAGAARLARQRARSPYLRQTACHAKEVPTILSTISAERKGRPGGRGGYWQAAESRRLVIRTPVHFPAIEAGVI